MKRSILLLIPALFLTGCDKEGTTVETNKFINNVSYVLTQYDEPRTRINDLSMISFFSDGKGSGVYLCYSTYENSYCAWDFAYSVKDNSVTFPLYNGKIVSAVFYEEDNIKKLKIDRSNSYSTSIYYFADFIDYSNSLNN